MDANSARYLVSALIQATAISWSIVLVIHVFLRQRNYDRLRSLREQRNELQDDLSDRPLRIAEFENVKNRIINRLHATRRAKQSNEDLEERLSNIEANLKEEERELRLRQAMVKSNITSTKDSIYEMQDRFRALRIVSVCTFFTVLIGILSLTLLEDSSVFGVNFETVSVFITTLFSASTFLLLSLITLDLLRIEIADVDIIGPEL